MVVRRVSLRPRLGVKILVDEQLREREESKMDRLNVWGLYIKIDMDGAFR